MDLSSRNLPYVCSKRVKLCEELNFRHFELLYEQKNSPIDYIEALNLNEQLEKNRKDLEAKIKLRCLAIPDSTSNFLQTLQKLHKLILQNSELASIGEFRTNEEEVYVDIGNHQFKGSESENIENLLIQLWDRVGPMIEIILENKENNQRKRQSTIEMGSMFLPHFFRIHPFLDGNGRVGRFFLMLVVEYSDLDCVYSSDGRLYRRALRFVHRHYRKDKSDPSKLEEKNASWLLKKYLGKSILIPLKDDLEDIPPSNLSLN